MIVQHDLFGALADLPQASSKRPKGFRYQRDLISPVEERRLLAKVCTLPFEEFVFQGFTGKRQVISFGWRYDFSDHRLKRAEAIPAFLLALRPAMAAFAGLETESLEQVLVTRYSEGAGIGWHRDKAVFGQTVGLSLLAPCVFRLRLAAQGKWQRAKLITEPRSAYLLSGPSRSQWEHSIPPVDALRYSITFRNLQQG